MTRWQVLSSSTRSQLRFDDVNTMMTKAFDCQTDRHSVLLYSTCSITLKYFCLSSLKNNQIHDNKKLSQNERESPHLVAESWTLPAVIWGLQWSSYIKQEEQEEAIGRQASKIPTLLAAVMLAGWYIKIQQIKRMDMLVLSNIYKLVHFEWQIMIWIFDRLFHTLLGGVSSKKQWIIKLSGLVFQGCFKSASCTPRRP